MNHRFNAVVLGFLLSLSQAQAQSRIEPDFEFSDGFEDSRQVASNALQNTIVRIRRAEQQFNTANGETKTTRLLNTSIRVLSRYRDYDIQKASDALERAVRVIADFGSNHYQKEDVLRQAVRYSIRSIQVSRAYRDERDDQNSNGRIEVIAQASGKCIGGERCGRQNAIHIGLGRGAYVEYVEFYADDRIGSKHKATLVLFADGRAVSGQVDVLKDGGLIHIPVRRNASYLEIRPGTDDEANIDTVRVFGRLR